MELRKRNIDERIEAWAIKQMAPGGIFFQYKEDCSIKTVAEIADDYLANDQYIQDEVRNIIIDKLTGIMGKNGLLRV